MWRFLTFPAWALITVTVIAGVASNVAYSQAVISAHSGVIHYVEGEVTIDGTPTDPKFTQTPQVKFSELRNNQILETREGRAEILLTPGIFLRLAEDSSVRMDSNVLSDTRLELLKGTALVEVAELLPGNAITIRLAGLQVGFPKRGLFRLEAEAERVRV